MTLGNFTCHPNLTETLSSASSAHLLHPAQLQAVLMSDPHTALPLPAQCAQDVEETLEDGAQIHDVENETANAMAYLTSSLSQVPPIHMHARDAKSLGPPIVPMQCNVAGR